MSKYVIYSDNQEMVVRDDGASISISEKNSAKTGNRDYLEYIEWLSNGNKPEYIERDRKKEKEGKIKALFAELTSDELELYKQFKKFYSIMLQENIK